MSTIDQTIGRKEFLKLFTTQLRFQDPLNPLKSTEFTAQLAQFSSLEQLLNINKNLSGILTYQNSLNNALATNLIGRTVVVDGTGIDYNGSDVTISYSLPESAAELKLNIYDQSGTLVRSVDLGSSESGDGSCTWDGRDNNGNTVPEGTYTYEFQAKDGDGNTVEVSTNTESRVTGITFDNGITYLELENGERVSLGEIKEIKGGGV